MIGRPRKNPVPPMTPAEVVARAELAIALLKVRLQKKLTQDQLAALAGVSQDTVSAAENMQRRLGHDSAMKLAGAAGFTITVVPMR
jgi:transcriptional regulator with XRE-family HTH domain